MFPPVTRRRVRPELHVTWGKATDRRSRQKYVTVQFDDGPWWLAENLNFDAGWSSIILPHRTPSRAGVAGNGRSYTFLSALAAAEDFGDGWRLPSDDDWRQLALALGGYYDYATRSHYGNDKPAAHKDSDRTKLALYCGGWQEPGVRPLRCLWRGGYWSDTTTALGSLKAWCYAFSNDRRGICRFAGYRRNWYAVRLVRG